MSDEKASFEVPCPHCKRKVKVTVGQAEATGKVLCPCGKNIELAKGLGG
jgi:hypothetical protein